MTSLSPLKLLRERTPIVSVGALTADWMDLGRGLAAIEDAGVRAIHFDVMDGCYCPTLTMGPPIIKAIRSPMLKDVHLMVREPLEQIEDYVKAGADIVTTHVEATTHPHRVLQKLGKMTHVNDPDREIVRGVALNPGTPIETLEPLLDETDLILLLAVNPGWGGQSFIPSTHARIARVRQMVHDHGKDILIGVDGGVTRDNIRRIAATGVDLIVTGSAVFDGKAAANNARFMLNAIENLDVETHAEFRA